AWLYAHARDRADTALRARYAGLLQRREAGEPVAYLVGRRPFWTLELQVTPDTLIPRPETELLVELALERIDAAGPEKVLDLGTGSGAIALAIASERPRAQVMATDASAQALEVARANARANGVANVWFACGEWYSAVEGRRFDAIVGNPPYIAQDDPHLEQGDLRYEPRAALVSGVDGLDAIRAIVAGAPAHLFPGGRLLLEHGFDQGPAVRSLLEAAGFSDVRTFCDLEGRERVSGGRLG
ncbi:MAG TPA: peptide chain release factor N(5)-glutamine methyltransferase, partial [Xanthomonadaceae bacterium]|nr:peptide chain release factor N(5)-glutamine methyltransferase [Xanthomonadaceae bacterium]